MCILIQGYQFWTRTDIDGNFCINNIQSGDYNLNAWVPGFVGDYQYEVVITITAGPVLTFNDFS
jgi:rhamnogalacturonan endolyase